MQKDRLKEIILDQKEVFSQQRDLIDRDVELERYIRTGQVVVISGIRRCGKSSLLFLIKERMKLEERNYCYFNFDDERIIPGTNLPDEIFNLHIEMYDSEPVIFFDEIQNIQGWEKFVNRLYEKGIKIFITGSNARLLSSEISTSLTGRNMVLNLYPFSFSEYLRFEGRKYELAFLTSGQKALLRKDFSRYMETGGFPMVLKEKDLELLNGLFQDILYRDIVSRYRISQVNELKEIALYFASNCGKLFSYSTLQAISGIKSLSSIKDYLEYYAQSHLFFYLKKYDHSVKKQIMNPKKVYLIDPGMINRMGFNFSANKGRVLENIVFLELLRRGKEVYYYSGKNECDFLVKEGLHITEAIQVSWSVNKENYPRESEGLKEVMRNFDQVKGLLISDDISGIPEDQSIKAIDIRDWLIG